ncbi:MAG TPA: PACE efflux transporter [Pseudomonas sabulinigri]|uniref:Chlorhexidine efflux transporter domain-containing protein n=1 Tax=marine sediment metagenome TaxID=412755 RepID=A0A0F9XJY4_9ZZZZ|nr:PACE efflux transporter [Halopseudomonas sabulinigri]HEC53160.1 PACE efflux transporter [Halopseudomonas sabulinigri]
MQGVKRKLVYVTFYELIAVAVVTLTLLVLGHPVISAGVASIITSIVAVSWNLTWNTAFERWERQQQQRLRTIKRRVAHALGFELGLLVILVPAMAWWLGISLYHALVLDLGLLVFFVCYTFVFTLGFDKLFGLPLSAHVLAGEQM